MLLVEASILPQSLRQGLRAGKEEAVWVDSDFSVAATPREDGWRSGLGW